MNQRPHAGEAHLVELIPDRKEGLFARILRLLEADLAARDIQMTTRVEPEPLELAMDAELLDQAMINLVRNAVEALGDTPAGVIALTARRNEGRIVISVAGNGRASRPTSGRRYSSPLYRQAARQRHWPDSRAPDRGRPQCEQ